MTPDEMRIAIAEKCGWTRFQRILAADDFGPSTDVYWFAPGIKTGDFTARQKQSTPIEPPNYPSDLINACHEMENHILSSKDGVTIMQFVGWITNIAKRDHKHMFNLIAPPTLRGFLADVRPVDRTKGGGGVKYECQLCINWTETEPKYRFGRCSFFNKKTEWNAGVRWQTRNRMRVCEGFKRK